jgi:hypothetical protein
VRGKGGNGFGCGGFFLVVFCPHGRGGKTITITKNKKKNKKKKKKKKKKQKLHRVVFSIGSEESSIWTWNRREKFTGSEGLSTRTRNRRPGPRICRPGVEIVDQVRDFIDRVRGIVDQDDEWSMKIYRVRGMVDQGLKSSTRS